MAAKDKYHQEARRSLEKDGWSVTHDPYFIVSEGVNFPVDLAAERIIAAEKGNEKIAVEVKSFLRESLVNEFHQALGQYLDYEIGLEEQEPDRRIVLAVTAEVFDKITKIPLLMRALDKFRVSVMVFDHKNEVIIQWIKKQPNTTKS